MAARSLPFTIPKKIVRSKTDILKALSATVGVDKTAPHFAVPAKRNCFLAREFGKRAARQLAEEWPTLFMFDRDKPRLEAFRPEKLPELVDNEPVDEAALLRFLDAHRVGDALKVFDRLRAEKAEVSGASLLRLFQLAAYFNCENAPPAEIEKWPGVRLFFESAESNGQQHAELMELLFKQVPDRRHLLGDDLLGLQKLLDEMLAAKHTPEAAVFTHLIRSSQSFNEVKGLMGLMANLNVSPSIQHFNAAIEVANKSTKFEQQWKGTQEWLAEAAALHLRPSLTTYGLVVSTLTPADPKASSKQLGMAPSPIWRAGRPSIRSTPPTTTSCLHAMDVATLANNPQLVDRVLALYESPKNRVKMVAFHNEATFYARLLFFKIETTNIEETERIYRELVPRVCDRPWPLFRRVIEDSISARHLFSKQMMSTLTEELRSFDPALEIADREDYEALVAKLDGFIKDMNELLEADKRKLEQRQLKKAEQKKQVEE
ncbi:Protein PTCD3-like protein, mitochondrial [Aphelenchoides fujianensis]|nr:Protein PTCD3-like protein, mitochondrial [Aphelenchoides fujianensis]